MKISHVYHQAKKTTTGAVKGALSGAKAGLDQAQKEVACLQAINNVKGKVLGLDPRTWMTACAKATLFQMKGPEYFKACLENKIRTEVRAVTNPKAFAESLWDEIKDSCPCGC